MWFAVGWVAVAVGSIGVVVPGLPTTVFFIIAAACFARSSAALLAIGALYIVFRVPTRERVLGQAALAQEAANRS
jgi:uncharacterized protein YqgC (DUF456 family)